MRRTDPESQARLRVAVVAPPWLDLPPRNHGAVEWICHLLAKGLEARGHEVTLIGAGPSHVGSRSLADGGVPLEPRVEALVPDVLHQAEIGHVLARIQPDVVHDHTVLGPLLAAGRPFPTVVTAHGPVQGGLGHLYRRTADDISLVAISDSQRRLAASLPWVATVPDGVDVSSLPFRANKEGFVLFLGRMGPEGGLADAIDAARRAGVGLVIATKGGEPAGPAWREEELLPRLGPGIRFAGSADQALEKDLLARARCLVLPVQWDDPSGLVMAEAMACGTPVVALRRGAVPDVVTHGRTGYVCDTGEELADAISRTDLIDPHVCRAEAEQRFDVKTMVAGYEQVYRSVLDQGVPVPRTVPGGGHRLLRDAGAVSLFMGTMEAGRSSNVRRDMQRVGEATP